MNKTFSLAIVCLSSVILSQARAADNELTDQEKKDGWILMFDGKSPDHWKCGDKPLPAAQVQDGAINTKGQNCYVNNFDQKFSDFHFMCDFKFEKGTNSGIFIRGSKLGGNGVERGLEIQVIDCFGKPKLDKHDMGALYDLQEPTKNAAKPAGEWNHIEIIAKGTVIKVILNGEAVNEADFAKWTEANKNPDGTKNKFKWPFKDLPKEGFIGFQEHKPAHDCFYKNVKVKPLK